MNEVLLLLGTNMGSRMDNLLQSIRYIEQEIGMIEKKSSVYESEPWGFEADTAFLNIVLIVRTALTPEVLLQKINDIERRTGRIRSGSPGYSSRVIDIDILFYNADVINLPELQIPHSRLHERRFTLEPLVEIVPEKEHPVFGKNMVTLLAECKDALSVRRVE